MMGATDIYQSNLDTISRALWDRDYETIARMNRFPHIIRHPNENRRFETPEQLIEMADSFRNHLEGLGATGYHRVCERASFDPLDPDRITGAHWSYILRGGNYLSEPYSCEMVLGRHDFEWLIEDIVVPSMRHGIPTPHPGHPGGGSVQ